MEDNLFDLAFNNVDKNSREFDLELLKEIKSLSNIPVNKFDSIMRKIMRKKTTCKLWFTNIPSNEWDGKSYRYCNYRCCPSSHKARHFFCLVLNRDRDFITVTDGFLTAV